MSKSQGSARTVTRRVIAGLTAVLAVFALMTTLSAQEFDISIPIDTIIGAPEGSKTLLASVDVPAASQGQECKASVETGNQRSEHPDNDISVESGSTAVVVEDVESGSFQVIHAEGTLVLGPTIDVYLIMGPDERFSAGLDVVSDCSVVETTTTTAPETTTTTVEVGETTITTTPATTTTTPVETTLPPTTTTFPDEVLPTEVTTTTVEVAPTTLPFTGSDSENLALIAFVLTGIGILTLVATRSRVED